MQNPHQLVGHVEQRHVVSRSHDTGNADTLAAHRFGFLVNPRPQFVGDIGPQRQPGGFAILGVDASQHDDGPLIVEQHVTDGECCQFAPPQSGGDEHGIEQRPFPPQAFKPLDDVGPQACPAPVGGSDDGVGRQFGTLPRCTRLCRPSVVDDSNGGPPVLGDGPQPGDGEQPPQFAFGKGTPLASHVTALVDARTLAQPGERVDGETPRVDEPVAPGRERAEFGVDSAGSRPAGHKHVAIGVDDGRVGQFEQPGHPCGDGVTVQVSKSLEAALGDGHFQVALDVLDVPFRSRAVCPTPTLMSQVRDVGVGVLGNRCVGMVGDGRFGCRHDAGSYLLGSGFQFGKHGTGSVE